MKTQETLKLALTKYKKELDQIRERIDWATSWLDAASFTREPELFVAQVKERDDLRRRETEMDFKIRFVEWILEDEKQKESDNG